MTLMMQSQYIPTNDKLIRTALKHNLEIKHKGESHTKIVEELGLRHGAARVDIAVVNGSLHGYELKSDLDTLNRLPEQMKIYNSVLDKITLVVGKLHLHSAMKVIPDWWGVSIAKILKSNGKIVFCKIRKSEENPLKDSVAIAKLLWREEALDILEQLNHADGVRSKRRQIIYERLAEVLDQKTLRKKVRDCLFFRTNWRFEKSHTLNDD